MTRASPGAMGRWRLKDVPGCITQGRTSAQARKRIRDALALFAQNAARAELVDDVRLPGLARRAIGHVASTERQVERALALARSAKAVAAQVLTGPPLRLSVRDAAEVLGLSHQRIQQLKSSRRGLPRRRESRGQTVVRRLRGSATVKMTTGELMGLTRGWRRRSS